jgi:hypothetical protein
MCEVIRSAAAANALTGVGTTIYPEEHPGKNRSESGQGELKARVSVWVLTVPPSPVSKTGLF